MWKISLNDHDHGGHEKKQKKGAKEAVRYSVLHQNVMDVMLLGLTESREQKLWLKR